MAAILKKIISGSICKILLNLSHYVKYLYEYIPQPDNNVKKVQLVYRSQKPENVKKSVN